MSISWKAAATCGTIATVVAIIAASYPSAGGAKACTPPIAADEIEGMHLAGGGGADQLIFGDSGVELAVYNSPTDSPVGGYDLVEGFQLRQDKIDLRNIDGAPGKPLTFFDAGTADWNAEVNVPSRHYTILRGREENESFIRINTGGDEADAEIYVKWHGKPGETLSCEDVLE